MEEKSDCTTNGLNIAIDNIVDFNESDCESCGGLNTSCPQGCVSDENGVLFIDTESEPGSWKEALKYSQHIIIKD